MNVAVDQSHNTPTVAELLDDVAGAPNTVVSGITDDSRKVQPGDLFLACQGISSHGAEFLQQAEANGAAAVAWDSSTVAGEPVTSLPNVGVNQLASRVGAIADRFYASPSRQLQVIGVTGTNGKSTVAWMLAQSLQLMHERCGYLGTLGAGVEALQDDVDMTTPAAPELHRQLASFVDQGATAAAIEVSSHALTQGRTDGVRFAAAIFTNLTRDHLDYHGDMQSYFDAKSRLFLQNVPPIRVVNIDSPYGRQLAELCGENVVCVSSRNTRLDSNQPHVCVTAVDAGNGGSHVQFSSSWGDGEFSLHLPGDFNVDNAMAVVAYHLCSGASLEATCEVVELLKAPPGRMQAVGSGTPSVYVDYAHTPDALRAALRALRPHTGGNLWCMFGCGGDRDRGKRAEMGATASEIADHVVLTNDNPRNESASEIIREITTGVADGSKLAVIEDRAAAIAWCIAQAADNDVVLLAGKGHEEFQVVGDQRFRFSDVAVARQALAARQVRS